MYSLRKRRGNTSSTLIIIFLLVMIITLPTTMTTSTTTNHVYGQQPNQMDLNVTDLSPSLQNIPVEKIRVGDIEIAYKTLGKGDPILLISGSSADMNAWDPSS
jgi:hypothetical protein